MTYDSVTVLVLRDEVIGIVVAQPFGRREEAVFDLDLHLIDQLLLLDGSFPRDALALLSLLGLLLQEAYSFGLLDCASGCLLFDVRAFTLCASRSAFLLFGVALPSPFRGASLLLLVEGMCAVAVGLRAELSDRTLVALIGLSQEQSERLPLLGVEVLVKRPEVDPLLDVPPGFRPCPDDVRYELGSVPRPLLGPILS